MFKRSDVGLFAVALLAAGLLAGCKAGSAEPTPTATPARFVAPVPFNPTATLAPVAQAVSAEDAIQVENTSVKVQPPGQCHLVENLSENERLSAVRYYDYKLNFGFGCPASDGNLRLDELRFQTASSVAAYDSQCASGGCDSGYVTPADFEAQKTALTTGQAVAGWTLVDVGGRSVLARSLPVEGQPIVMRQYAEFCGDVRVENRVVMLGDSASSLADAADSFFASMALTCQAGA